MGPYRGVGRPITTFVLESLIDRAARRLALDPAELRLKNYIRADEFPYKNTVRHCVGSSQPDRVHAKGAGRAGPWRDRTVAHAGTRRGAMGRYWLCHLY